MRLSLVPESRNVKNVVGRRVKSPWQKILRQIKHPVAVIRCERDK